MENESFEIVQDSSYLKDNSFLSPPNEALRIQENEIQKLKKLNFNLKLRICQLEEQLGVELTGNEDVSNTRRISAYSDSEEKDSPYPSRTSILKELEEEIYRRDLLLTKARTVILSLQKQLSYQDNRHRNDQNNRKQQINDSDKNYEANREEINEETNVRRLVEVSQRILQKFQHRNWDPKQLDSVPSCGNLSYVLDNLILVEKKMNEVDQTSSYEKEIRNSNISKFGNSSSTDYEADKENMRSCHSDSQQSSLMKVRQLSSSSPMLQGNDFKDRDQYQTTLDSLLDSVRELGELAFDFDRLFDREQQVTPLPLLSMKQASNNNLEELQNAVIYVTNLQHFLRSIKTKVQSHLVGLYVQSPIMQSELNKTQLLTLEDSMQNFDTAPTKKETSYNSGISKTPNTCQNSFSVIHLQKYVNYPCSEEFPILTEIDTTNSELSDFVAQCKVDKKECIFPALKAFAQLCHSVYFGELQKILAETELLDKKIQKAQQKVVRIQQEQLKPLASNLDMLNSSSNNKVSSFHDANNDDSSSDDSNNLNSVRIYQESFSNLVSFVTGAFTIFEEIDFDQQFETSMETGIDTTAKNRLFTWGQSVLAPSPFSPGSSRGQEYVLTMWSREKTAYEGLDLLRNTVEEIINWKDQRKYQQEYVNVNDMRQLAKSLALCNTFVQRLSNTIIAKQSLTNQRMRNLEKRWQDFKHRAVSNSVKTRETNLPLSNVSLQSKPLSGRPSNHKALKKWVLEQISETQRTIQQTQKSLDNERKYLLYNWLSSDGKALQ